MSFNSSTDCQAIVNRGRKLTDLKQKLCLNIKKNFEETKKETE